MPPILLPLNLCGENLRVAPHLEFDTVFLVKFFQHQQELWNKLLPLNNDLLLTLTTFIIFSIVLNKQQPSS